MPDNVSSWLIQGGAFGLLAMIVLATMWYAVPYVVRTQKDHVDQLIRIFTDQANTHKQMVSEITSAMRSISTEMQNMASSMGGFNSRLEDIEEHLDLPEHATKGGCSR